MDSAFRQITASPIIVGDARDSHVVAVVAALARLGDEEPFIFDAPSVRRDGFYLERDEMRIAGVSRCLSGGRGWLRRYAPAMWGAGTVAGSLDAVTHRAFLGLVGSIGRLGGIQWLTPLDNLLRAEDKLFQLQEVARIGARVPRTVVTSDGLEAERILHDGFVVKPLVGGFFHTDDGPRAVYAASLRNEEQTKIDFGAAPFLAQERIDADEHLRVVTVGDRAWSACLTAQGRPLDWRQQDRAHFEWDEAADHHAEDLAVSVAAHLGLGYSSQDWIRDKRGLVFLDLNPGGQWMFLPRAVADPVTDAIAEFLADQ